ncbi:NmrA family NAD(P)-binding protein [Mycobacterium sp. 3519A]|uniref:NmrA family NAD(P)-binding protein n=1 Tax=Mycobacterium sp. 3519A TaxID=2057184 RepID=UPI000C7DF8D7|nr:NmrA family NAD(P)-binding protein [Mycobacterium sp. 3519A]
MLLILGPTGQVGTHVIAELGRRGTPFRAVVRTAAAAARVREAGGQPVTGDLAHPETVAPHMADVSRMFLLTPGSPDQLRIQNRLVDSAKQAGVAAVVKLSVYTAAEDSPCSLSRWHWANDEYLKASGLAWSILYPHTFMQSIALQFARAVRDTGVIQAAVGPDKAISMVDVRDVAHVAAAVLCSDAHHGREYLITGPEPLTYADCARKLSRSLGRHVDYVRVAPQTAHDLFTAGGFPEWLADALVALFAMYDTGELNPISDVTATLVGRPARTFDDFLADDLALFS